MWSGHKEQEFVGSLIYVVLLWIQRVAASMSSWREKEEGLFWSSAKLSPIHSPHPKSKVRWYELTDHKCQRRGQSAEPGFLKYHGSYGRSEA